MTGIDGLLAKLKRWLKGPPGVVLPPGTTLLKSDGLVPRGFRHGIELLNDDYTPMEFVVTVLESSAGLRHTEAVHAMLEVHSKAANLSRWTHSTKPSELPLKFLLLLSKAIIPLRVAL